MKTTNSDAKSKVNGKTWTPPPKLCNSNPQSWNTLRTKRDQTRWDDEMDCEWWFVVLKNGLNILCVRFHSRYPHSQMSYVRGEGRKREFEWRRRETWRIFIILVTQRNHKSRVPHLIISIKILHVLFVQRVARGKIQFWPFWGVCPHKKYPKMKLK